MIITCPHCQTKYQVTYEAIGSAGRKVQCAHCHQAWNQDPTPKVESKPAKVAKGPVEAQADKLFDAMAEDALDEAMSAEESAATGQGRTYKASATVSETAQMIDPAELQKRQAAFARRQNAMFSSLPLARMRRSARLAGMVILAGIVAGAYFGRVPIVERYPDLAGLYEAVGLGVNVVGLDFSNLETLKTLSGGNDVLTVSAQIVGRAAKPVPVPPVVISLLDAQGKAIYEWSVSPRVNDLMAGERATFDTRLSLPPSEAVHVRLSFAGKGAPLAEPAAGAQASSEQQPGMADTHALPAADVHGAPEGDAHAAPASTDHAAPAPSSSDHTAEPAHAPEPAATDHH